MLVSSVISAVVFFAGVTLLIPQIENHGLWLSMVLYLLMRGLVQTVLYFRFSRE